MKSSKRHLLAVIALLLTGTVCRAGGSAVVIVYQPIITASEAVTIETPKGFAVMPIPFICYHYQGRPPYHAIVLPNQILTDAPRDILSEDSNLLSSAGVVIGGSIDDETVGVSFRNLHVTELFGDSITTDDIAEAALECVRRLAHDSKQRPKLIITGKEGDEAKWQKWQKHFERHDLAKPFSRPGTS